MRDKNINCKRAIHSSRTANLLEALAKAGMCSEGCPARALSPPGPRPPGLLLPRGQGLTSASEGMNHSAFTQVRSCPFRARSRSAAGRLHSPTCSTKALGQIVKPRSAAAPRDSRTAAASSLGLSRVRGSVREAPRRTSPKQRKGDLQKWLRDRTAGDAASSSARGPSVPPAASAPAGSAPSSRDPAARSPSRPLGAPRCSERPPQERPPPPLKELGSRKNSPPLLSSC